MTEYNDPLNNLVHTLYKVCYISTISW